MPNRVLCVFEGEVREPRLFDSLERIFLPQQKENILHGVFGAELFQLWSEIKQDPFGEYLEIVTLLQKRYPDQLRGIKRTDVSDVFLFFDHDGHSHPELLNYHQIVMEMIDYFDGSTTDRGKIYISYPMVEAIIDASDNPEECFHCTVMTTENINYHESVNNRSKFNDIRRITKENWLYLFHVNLIKAMNLISEDGIITHPITDSDYNALTQENIGKAQGEIFNREPSRVVVLSGIPFFMIDYCPIVVNTEIKKILFQKPCSYFCIPSCT